MYEANLEAMVFGFMLGDGWRSRQTGVRIPNSFPKFEEFKKEYCSL